MLKKNKKINKKNFKAFHCICPICDLNQAQALQVHRIKEGKNGGSYSQNNSLSCCASCHNLIHHDIIKIIGKYMSTSGRQVLIYERDGQQFIKQIY